MSLAKKIFTSLVYNGFKYFSSNQAQISARKYHVMVNPLSKYPTGTSALHQNFISNVMVPLPITSSLLVPISSLINQVAGFKVKGRLKRRCKDCYFVIRQQRHYVICPTHPRHKQMAMKKRDYKSWILTHATQSKIRPY